MRDTYSSTRFPKRVGCPVASRQGTPHLVSDDSFVKNEIEFSAAKAHLRITRFPFYDLFSIGEKMVFEDRFEKTQKEVSRKFNSLFTIMVSIILLGVVEVCVDEVASHASQKVGFRLEII